MNRRNFLKAPASIPLLGVLIRSSRVGWLVADDDETSAAYRAYRQFYSDAVAGPEVPSYLDVVEEAEPDTAVGVCLFVDPVSGSDDNSGLASPLSLATLQRALEVLGEDAGTDGSLILVMS